MAAICVCLSPGGENKGLKEKDLLSTPACTPPSQRPHLLPERGITLSRRTSAPWNGRVTKSDLERQEGHKLNTDFTADSLWADGHLLLSAMTPTTQGEATRRYTRQAAGHSAQLALPQAWPQRRCLHPAPKEKPPHFRRMTLGGILLPDGPF